GSHGGEILALQESDLHSLIRMIKPSGLLFLRRLSASRDVLKELLRGPEGRGSSTAQPGVDLLDLVGRKGPQGKADGWFGRGGHDLVKPAIRTCYFRFQ